MKRQTVIALAVAVVLGLFAVYLLNTYIGRTDERVAAVEQGTTKVAVAAIPLDFGTDLTPDKVKFIDYPSASIPSGAFSSYNQIAPAGKRRVVLRPIALNEPILASKIAGEGLGPSIAYLLPDGMRAASVRINEVSGVSGFIQPMDAVDVLITRQLTGSGENRQITDVLLQNVKVIAIGQETKDAEGKPTQATTATLEVNPTDAQKLALGQQAGALSLVLRKPGQEQDVGRVATVSINDLRYSYYGNAPAPVAQATRPRVTTASTPRRQVVVRRPAPAQPRSNNVEVVRGTAGSNYEVGGYGS